MKPVMLVTRILAPVIALALASAGLYADDPFAPLRDAMVREIANMSSVTRDETGGVEFAAPVMAAMAKVPRHKFVPPDEVPYAYENRPLPIGYGQTISQPYIVALMTDLAQVGPGDVVLEIGTGSGYQAAILAELAQAVYTMEIIEPLAVQAEERLGRLGYVKVQARLGDGYHGWPEHGPYDAILVTAAASHVPPPLIAQLKAGGRMVIPVGASFMIQYLLLIEKAGDGSLSTRQVLPVRFVPLVEGG
ncbi:protein-L-isoaspartate(D-aspartate) O-methyltransferase [Pseudomonas cucumis]|uniref:Protein-L-isoaspartate O-methyltransferase n=1 Tax=Pseudomonas cucumis TaxID=2954082 RepID=A0ABY9F2V3_9PSED|nr:protein-L-isoaspartate(D-aspartate) O-methyltransferase [Pseudomonas cucumis]WLG87084.1 protein-L-isoaspartate(D-aspartate) O-methyltransferase [Pseudomonas cucumis]